VAIYPSPQAPPRRRLVVSFDDEPEDDIVVLLRPRPAARAHIAPSAARQAMVRRYRYASWSRRVGATLIDAAIVLAATFLVAASAGAFLMNSDDGGFASVLAAILLYLVASIVAHLLYAPALLARKDRHNGQTLGKQVVGIRVRRADGLDMTLGTAVLREVAMKHLAFGLGGVLLLWVPLLANCSWPLWDLKRRALHDIGAATVVLRAT
jgi:uncharacterized RDD family membrane protein YckC